MPARRLRLDGLLPAGARWPGCRPSSLCRGGGRGATCPRVRGKFMSLNRVRIVATSPGGRAHEFVAGVIRDYGHSVSACSQAVWTSLRSLCIKRKGKRGPDFTTGAGDALDEGLLQRLKEITFAGSSDGCEVAVQGLQSLRLSGRLEQLRYQFRDRPHTARSCVKNVLSYMAEGKALMEAMISGKDSFCKMVKHRRRFQALWKKRQSQDLEEFMNVVQNLAYEECHSDHKRALRLPASSLPLRRLVVIRFRMPVGS